MSPTLAVIMWGNLQVKRLGCRSSQHVRIKRDLRSIGCTSWGLCAYFNKIVSVFSYVREQVNRSRNCLHAPLKKTSAFGWPPPALTLDHGWLGVDNECRCWEVNVNLYVKGLGLLEFSPTYETKSESTLFPLQMFFLMQLSHKLLVLTLSAQALVPCICSLDNTKIKLNLRLNWFH